ncbi:hypothetical protein IWQ60_010252 [Tieghemiomyces parasiticus]|uniref:Outer kinetochore protein DAM1 n=1 Tax=Tieghemiomyces parasiticus TaxID=78921 RepID=A0A9W7ZR26_9FUNG|nr:hypothetical protein IWQ60_010252 [Tieghemiomyces parasiticus]
MPIPEHIQRPLVDITDQMGELQRNMQTLQDLNQHFVRFNVSFGSFLLGIKANTQVVDFSESLTDAAAPATITIGPTLTCWTRIKATGTVGWPSHQESTGQIEG